MTDERAQAVADVREARQSHVHWADYLENNPAAAAEPEPRAATAGDVEHHREWVERYDRVLRVLGAA